MCNFCILLGHFIPMTSVLLDIKTLILYFAYIVLLLGIEVMTAKLTLISSHLTFSICKILLCTSVYYQSLQQRYEIDGLLGIRLLVQILPRRWTFDYVIDCWKGTHTFILISEK